VTEPTAMTGVDEPTGDRPGGTGRLIFDITRIASWCGPPVGIVRTVHEFARYARDNRPDIVPAFYDPSFGFRTLDPGWARRMIELDCTIDPLHSFRRELSPVRRWLSRYPAVMALESIRLTTNSAAVSRAADLLQRALFMNRHVPPFVDARGRRSKVVPTGFAFGPVLSLGPQDILISAGDGWLQKGIGEIAEHKRRLGFRLVVQCYDLIPLTHSDFFFAHDVDKFRAYWTMMFGLADRVIFNSRCIEADARQFCQKMGIRIGNTAVVPLGYDAPHVDDDAPACLPAELEPDRYAVFVSTVEPRKGHGLLLRVWRRLLADGVPQRHRFNLVFVGRRGWKVDPLLREIDATVGPETFLRHYADMSDQDLSSLYRHAAFCLYPSVYEGFGLPIIEAYSHGKAVLASRGGALPETVGGLSPCLDPHDEAAWYVSLRQWIEDPARRQPFEERIRASFSPAPWHEVAERFFAVASAAPHREPNPS
jgi:glycosyltransferase involved in cell wall biosynthesis